MIRNPGSINKVHTPIVDGILWVTAVHMIVCGVIFLLWRIEGNNARIDLFFQYQGSLFFVLCAAAELLLAWTSFRQFSRGEPMYTAWLFIVLASLYRFIGYIFSQILCTESYLNPVYILWGARNAAYYQACKQFGLILGGPLSMAILAVGLFRVVKMLRRLRILTRLRPMDILLISAVIAFTLRQIYEIAKEIVGLYAPYDLYKILAWPSDLLLCVLLLEAILIRRSAVQTGWGLLAKSWGAFSVGILFTSLGDIGLWATTNHNYIPWPYSSLTWFIWFLASAAYALGPAYQVEACRHAYREAKAISIGPSTPASAPE